MDIRRLSLLAATLIAIPLAVHQYRSPPKISPSQVEARYKRLFPPPPPATAFAFAPPPPTLVVPTVELPPLPPLPEVVMPRVFRSIEVGSIPDHATVDVSRGAPVISDKDSDAGSLARAIKEIDEAAKGVTFDPPASRPADTPKE